MEEWRKKKVTERKALLLFMLLGFTLVLFLCGCGVGAVAGMILEKSTDPTAWGGLFGLVGFFVGIVVMVRVEDAPDAH